MPDLYPYALDGPDAVMVAMDRASYRQSIFLDQRIVAASDGSERTPIAALPLPADTAGWIFHVAHCGSTLLARALEVPNGLVLREPLALRQLGLAPDATALPGIAGLLSRRWPGDVPTIIKANVPVNFILPDLLALQPGAPVLLLYFPLGDYLAAILRSDNHRAWVRGITDALRGPIAALAGPLPDGDVPRAAALWLAQMRAFAAVLDVHPASYSLDAEDLFARPEAVLQAAARLFRRDLPDIAGLVAGPLFNSYAKNPAVAFDNLARLDRRDATNSVIAADVAAARAWLAGRMADYPLPLHLTRPLLAGEQRPLLS